MMDVLAKHIKAVLALILVIACLAYLFMITLMYKGDSNIISQALIAVVTALSTATGYYFGYSQGAAHKDSELMTGNKPTVAQADTVNVTNEATPKTGGEEDVK